MKLLFIAGGIGLLGVAFAFLVAFDAISALKKRVRELENEQDGMNRNSRIYEAVVNRLDNDFRDMAHLREQFDTFSLSTTADCKQLRNHLKILWEDMDSLNNNNDRIDEEIFELWNVIFELDDRNKEDKAPIDPPHSPEPKDHSYKWIFPNFDHAIQCGKNRRMIKEANLILGEDYLIVVRDDHQDPPDIWCEHAKWNGSRFETDSEGGGKHYWADEVLAYIMMPSVSHVLCEIANNYGYSISKKEESKNESEV